MRLCGQIIQISLDLRKIKMAAKLQESMKNQLGQAFQSALRAFMIQLTNIIKQQMYVIQVTLILLIHILVTLQQSVNIKVSQKNVNFLADIRPDYSLTDQIYQEIEQKNKQKQARIRTRPPAPTHPVPQPEQQPVQQTVTPVPEVQKKQEKIGAENLKSQEFKLNTQSYTEFVEGQQPVLKESKTYTISNIDENGVLQNKQNTAIPSTQPTPQSIQTPQTQTPQQIQAPPTQQIQIQPTRGEQINSPQPVPQQSDKRSRTPSPMSREQQFIDALQRAENRLPPSQLRVQPTLASSDRNQGQQTATNTNEVKVEVESESRVRKHLFSLFLMVSILVIVFSYSPQEQKPARKAYNPSDDEEINLA